MAVYKQECRVQATKMKMKMKRRTPQNVSLRREEKKNHSQQNDIEKGNQNENADERKNISECELETRDEIAIKDQQDEKQNMDGFMYAANEKMIVFQRMSDDYVMMCPICHTKTKYIIRHIQNNNNCKLPGEMDSFIEEFKVFKQKYTQELKRNRIKKRRLEDNDKVSEQERKHNRASRKRRREENSDQLKAQQRHHTKASMEKKRKLDNEKVKDQKRKQAKSSMEKRKEEDYQKVKDQQRKRAKSSLEKRREQDYEKVKDQQKIRAKSSMEKRREQDYEKVKDQQRKRAKSSMEKAREHDSEKFKFQQRKHAKASIEVRREQDNEKVKDQQRKRAKSSIEMRREQDINKVKSDQVTRSRLSRTRKKLKDPKKVKDEEKERQQRHREVKTKSDRLRAFRDATKYNAVFLCTCCHQRTFHSNIQLYTDALKKEINAMKPGHIEVCVENKIPTYINGEERTYVCKTCVRHMKKKKLPPMSAMNNLWLTDTDKKIEKEGLKLTELEGALIAKSIIFQKIYQLPKSRWTALKDRLINIPINDDDIMNTLEQMPRTPKDAGLIGVALKRKKEYKNSHKHQLIDPSKLFKMLDKLKRSGNKYYKFYDDYNQYHERCKETDPNGYNVLFVDDVEEVVEKMNNVGIDVEDEMAEETGEVTLKSNEDDNDSRKEEIEYQTKDPVKRYQFEYNKSLCMAHKYPEITATDDVSIAPGEGKIPKDIMAEEDWDIKAFPHLNNPDGSNGKDQERRARLTDQNFFIQRICNKEARFARSPAYMYAAIGYLEKNQMQRNINMANTRGKEVRNEMGEKSGCWIQSIR